MSQIQYTPSLASLRSSGFSSPQTLNVTCLVGEVDQIIVPFIKWHVPPQRIKEYYALPAAGSEIPVVVKVKVRNVPGCKATR